MGHVLVLGGGFAGVEAATRAAQKGMRVTLVSDRDYLFVYPISIWIPTGTIGFEQAQIPLAQLGKKHGFEVIVEQVTGISATGNRVTLGSGRVIDHYDDLVVALGSAKVPTPGAAHTLSICGAPQQSVALKEQLEALVARGNGRVAIGFGGNPKDPSAVRGGPAFEVLFNIHHFLEKKGVRDQFELTFFAPMEKPGKRMGEKALLAMDKMFERAKVNRVVGRKIDRFEQGRVVFADQGSLEADLIMFISAGAGAKVIRQSDLPTNEAGFVLIDEFGRVSVDGALTNVWAIGDSAALDGPPWKAKQGHVAEVMGQLVAHNIAVRQGQKGAMKSYVEHLSILCVMDTGDGAAFVHRTSKKATMVPLPVVGHWLKKGWGFYVRHSKLKHMPRLPGM